MEPEIVKTLIEAGIPGAKVEVVDTTGTKDHFSAVVISDSFDGLSLVDQHQAVYKAVGNHMTKEIHALQLKTYSPQQWAKNNS
ncbi:MAG: BolA/IbaG family iron-sulfur metabolism protein [Candidatus Marinimicrobia bacterium]|jgi:acid stress-induced BolA-like protein IbaG/YrbA|nr:BolA/IbaG family iron-sulfur metabolism protein [Candidatus Neomarinimicrobiota bacterium]MBT3676688.1 BolA/IbaG family iron-sulfur metabolism protein [Candidatus Neomarinimicrobiota bacterium]MBT3762646.1 BolA/IbaG family iron-sulfur metabolism protein [Candidatus Neomarinimicrobiota bacterium]MBT4068963.1 BolA/IbaG family iron-sulfur metabolism protein [Candidatus Neomarinimicrobiota bacterium]MBT4270697.1 BolA/IbaG family iron-sulfur metabolism protein [Candidatus Neomarinimicrobiota bact